MQVKDLQARMGKVDITITILDKGSVREFEKFGKQGRVCTATAEDETGKINLTLWNDDIDKINAGDKVQIKNGYVGEYQGELQLSTGKFGQLEVLEKGSEQPAEAAPAAEEVPEEPIAEEEAVKNGEDE